MKADSHKTADRALLTIDNVQKTFADFVALHDASFDIKDNELFTLLGPSGCGKTTLLRIIAGFEHPTQGRLLLDSKDIAGEPPYRRPINTMFQSYALFPHLNVWQNVSYGLEMLKWSKADTARRVEEVLALVHMQDFADRRTTQMSGGQQQRIALARALAPRPRVLLLDEPLSALDLKLRKAMQIELKRLQRETALTFVLVTHDQEEALALSDRIAVMSKGKIQQIGTPKEIYHRPRNRFVADFIGEANLVPGTLLGREAKDTVCVRPENLTAVLVNAKKKGRLEGDVVNVTYLGADTLVEVHVAEGVSLRARMRGRPIELEQGARAALDWPTSVEWVVSE